MKKILVFFYSILFRKGHGTRWWKSKFKTFGTTSFVGYPTLCITPGNIEIGDGTTILKMARMQNYPISEKEEPRIRIGNGCYIGFFFTILNASEVIIGNDVLFASHVLITSYNHGIDPESATPYMDQPLSSKPVEIGDGCWIGEKVCIMPGVKIGRKCIIGGGSVVTKSIPDYSIAVGNPAHIIKQYNFEKHIWEKV